MKKKQKFGLVFLIFVAVYVLIYAILSINGRYQPAAVNLRGIMWSSWAPAGFYDAEHPWPGSVEARKSPNQKTGGWRASMIYAFLPLWEIDVHFIHKKIYGDPIN